MNLPCFLGNEWEKASGVWFFCNIPPSGGSKEKDKAFEQLTCLDNWEVLVS